MRKSLLAAALVLLPLSAVASNSPKSAIFHDPTTHDTCGPSGAADSTDPALNEQKNRIKPTPQTKHKTVAQFRALATPRASPKATRDQWSDNDANHVAQIESTPVHVIGYLVGRAREHSESTNCGADDADGVDTHTWLVDSPDDDKTTSIVAEVTPRWRLANKGWSPSALQALVEQGAQLRISGWPMFDEDHPEQLKKTRATLWEIHPITDIEVNTNGGWVELGTTTH